MAQKSIKIFILIEVVIICTIFISYSFFLSAQIAYLGAFFIILGSMLSYKKTVEQKLKTKQFLDDRDELDKIDDPFYLFSKDDTKDSIDIKNMNLKEIIKDEKKRVKIHNYKNLKLTSSAFISIFRIIPYLFLIIGFIILSKNNHLRIMPFLIFLLIGIYLGYLVAYKIFTDK